METEPVGQATVAIGAASSPGAHPNPHQEFRSAPSQGAGISEKATLSAVLVMAARKRRPLPEKSRSAALDELAPRLMDRISLGWRNEPRMFACVLTNFAVKGIFHRY